MANLLSRLLGAIPWRLNHREFLLRMLPQHSIGAEIGVHKGDFAAQIIRIVHPSELHLVDPWKHETLDTYKKAWYGGQAPGGQAELDARYEAVRRRFSPEISAGRVKIHRGYSSNVLDTFPDGYLDWVYIDANHLYEFARQDLALSFKKIKPGGHITGDDYGDGGWWQGGVKRAVDEFLQAGGVRLVTIRHGQFVLRK